MEYDKVTLVTGASSGIGAALARTLASKFVGVPLVLAARNKEKLQAVATECNKAGAEVLVVPTDMAQVEQAKALAKLALEHFGRVDALVNNAGYGQMGPVELISPEQAKLQFAVNFHGPLALTQALIEPMRNQGGGRVINVSSLGGRMAFPSGGLYSASKFALEALSDVLRMELAAFNIKVSVVEPGPVKTEFFSVAKEKIEETVDNSEQTLYQAAIKKIKKLDEQISAQAWSSERVASIIIQALTEQHPCPRYVAATGGKTLLFMMTKLMPTQFTDFFWKRFYGIDQVAKDWQSPT